MYEVHLSQRALIFLEKCDKTIRVRIETRLKKLAENPVPADAKFITRNENNNKIFRYRIGDFRALYLVKENEKIVLIAEIDKRPRIYD